MTKVRSPQLEARIAGALYLLVILAGIFGYYGSSSLVVHGDAAATAHNILASEQLFRLACAAELMAGALYVGVTALLYELLKPVSRSFSLAAALFSLVGIATGAANTANHLAPAVFLGNAHSLAAFTADQLGTLSFMSLRLYGQDANVGSVFFGLYCLSVGWLIVRSTFLPRPIGVLMMVAGAGYLLESVSVLVSPPFATRLPDFTLLLGLLGEGALTVWLLAFGVNVAQWKEAEQSLRLP